MGLGTRHVDVAGCSGRGQERAGRVRVALGGALALQARAAGRLGKWEEGLVLP